MSGLWRALGDASQATPAQSLVIGFLLLTLLVAAGVKW